MRLENVFGGGVLVALLDEQPVLCVLGVGIVAPAGADERERAVELEAVQVDVDFALADRVGGVAGRIDDVVDAAIPYDDRARAVVAGRNHAFEVAVLERMILDGDGEMLIGGIHRGAFRDGPRAQDAFHLESKIVVEAARGVLLDDEGAAGGGWGGWDFASEWFGSARGAALLSVLGQRHCSLWSGKKASRNLTETPSPGGRGSEKGGPSAASGRGASVTVGAIPRRPCVARLRL